MLFHLEKATTFFCCWVQKTESKFATVAISISSTRPISIGAGVSSSWLCVDGRYCKGRDWFGGAGYWVVTHSTKEANQAGMLGYLFFDRYVRSHSSKQAYLTKGWTKIKLLNFYFMVWNGWVRRRVGKSLGAKNPAISWLATLSHYLEGKPHTRMVWRIFSSTALGYIKVHPNG